MNLFKDVLLQLEQEFPQQDLSPLNTFDTPDNQALQVKALLYMLSRFPLDPEEVPRMLADVPRGIVRLSFMEVSSPVPVLFEVPGHPSLATLAQAIERNLQMPQSRAARALHKWKSLRKLGAYHRWERTCMDAHRRSLAWPTSQDYRNDRDEANRQMDRCGEEMRAHERKLRTSRLLRKQKIRELAGITASWFDITKELAMHLLNPGLANSNR